MRIIQLLLFVIAPCSMNIACNAPASTRPTELHSPSTEAHHTALHRGQLRGELETEEEFMGFIDGGGVAIVKFHEARDIDVKDYTALADKYCDFRFGTVDASRGTELVAEFGIEEFPAIYMFVDGEFVGGSEGPVTSETLTGYLDQIAAFQKSRGASGAAKGCGQANDSGSGGEGE